LEATLVTRFTVGVGDSDLTEREDRWSYTLASSAEGQIRHEMHYRDPRVGPRVTVEEAVQEAGRLVSRSGYGDFLVRDDDELWRTWLRRPGLDFAGFLRQAGLPEPARAQNGTMYVAVSEGSRAEVRVGLAGQVVGASLDGAGADWRVHFELALERLPEPPGVQTPAAVSPDRDRPVPRRRRLLDAGLGATDG